VLDSLLHSSLTRDTGMSHASRMFDERFNSSKTFCQGEDAKFSQEFFAFSESPFEFEAQHSSVASHLALYDIALRMIRQAGIVDLFHLGLLQEKLANLFRVGIVTIHPNSQGLDSSQHEPAV